MADEKLSSKALVLKTYPNAVATKDETTGIWYVLEGPEGGPGPNPAQLGSGTSALQAWNNAAKAITVPKADAAAWKQTVADASGDNPDEGNEHKIREVAPGFTVSGTQADADDLKARLEREQRRVLKATKIAEVEKPQPALTRQLRRFNERKESRPDVRAAKRHKKERDQSFYGRGVKPSKQTTPKVGASFGRTEMIMTGTYGKPKRRPSWWRTGM